jgi:hypothetical protein
VDREPGIDITKTARALACFCYSFDCNEPIHVHVRRERLQAKFWLAPVALAWNHGFSARELNDIRRLTVENEQAIIGAWYEHCGHR